MKETDLIRRSDAIDAVTNTSGIRGDALKALYDLPSAKPERKGEWFVDIYKYGKDRYECSECCKTTDVGYDFCPNCGADMRTE